MQLCCLPALIFLAFCLCGVVIRTRLEGAMKGSVMLKDLTFDLVLTDLKAQTQRKSLREIAGSLAGFPASIRPCWRGFSSTRRSGNVRRSGAGWRLLTCSPSAWSGRCLRWPCSIIPWISGRRTGGGRSGCRPLSPLKDGPVHLQKISGVSRLLRDDILCESLRMAKTRTRCGCC